MNREVILKALVGSHNYNLNGFDSDKDYKVFVLPLFDDLYDGKMYSKQTIGENEDLDFHDIRKLPNLFYKSNINFLEVLFSNEIIIHKGILGDSMRKVINMKDEIAKINLPYLYNACVGMHHNKMSSLLKGTEGTKHLVEMHGFDTKQALHSYRIIDFLVRYESNNFTDFKRAITYSGEDREFMFHIKNGYLDVDTFQNFISFYLEAKVLPLKEKYLLYKANKELKEEIHTIIKDIIKSHLTSA